MLFITLEAILAILISKKKSPIRNLISYGYAALISLQLSSLLFSGEFIQPLAINNIDEIGTIGIKPILLFLIPLTIIILLCELSKRWGGSARSNVGIFIAIFISMFFHQSVINSIFSCLKDIYDERMIIKTSGHERNEIGISLLKNKVVYNTSVNTYINQEKYNVIVIFAEGMSFDVISKELTPNIYHFMNSSINVNNYYNHTAATYRALRGQLTSSHQITGGNHDDKSGVAQLSKEKIIEKFGKESAVTSITTILKKHGYTTSFQSSNSKEKPLTTLNKNLGFDNIYGLEDLEHREKWQIDELSDKDSYSLLFDKLKEQKEPFFYAMYSVGTHIGLDSPVIKYRDGKNSYLNMFYNLDYQFGEFIKKFNSDDISKNTILIFTTDHAPVPTPEYKYTFKSENTFMVDRIPLIIYKKGITPSSINAKCINSLSLTPTILDILGINNEENKFLGLSIFDKKEQPRRSTISAISKQFYDTSRCSVIPLESEIEKEKIKKYQIFGG
ncbi:LTA synthase family protein [Xenorhabdus nematophila]|uniref:LTA synthase family protein n=1 Tax=Xenorhabdus nematophila TaxID=628 RepID=UPI0032B71925